MLRELLTTGLAFPSSFRDPQLVRRHVFATLLMAVALLLSPSVQAAQIDILARLAAVPSVRVLSCFRTEILWSLTQITPSREVRPRWAQFIFTVLREL